MSGPLHAELLAASQEIGGVCTSAAWWTHALAERLVMRGKDVNAMTVGELREVIAQHRKDFYHGILPNGEARHA